MEYRGLTLDKFQEDAIKAVDNNHSAVVSAPTGSGKTLIADYIIDKDIEEDIKVIYTAPIKALSNQKYKEFSEAFGEDKVGLLTGDVVINPEAKVLIMTTEIYRNMALGNDHSLNNLSYVIFDEIHYINDVERGYVWEESIIFSDENVRFLCLSATIPNAKEFARWIESIKNHEVKVIKHSRRPVPLHKKFYDSELGMCTLEEIKEVSDIPKYRDVFQKRGRKRRHKNNPPSHIELVKDVGNKLPCFFFTFSRKNCQKNAVGLAKKKIFPVNKEIISRMSRKLSKAPKEINRLKSTRMLKQALPHGVAFHHAGLLPVVKDLVEELFSEGLIKVLYTTETFAVGINMPAKTVCFNSLRKFDGVSFRFLNSKEYFQIAGRAGRRGIDKEGFVYSMIDRRDFDYGKLKKITSKDTDPIKSQFKLSINTVLNLIDQHGQGEIDKILTKNFYTFQKYKDGKPKQIHRTFENAKKKLEKLDYITDNSLTWKGRFASRIYSDEILTSELFGTDFWKGLNEYQALLLFAALSYEPREKTKFYDIYKSKFEKKLFSKIKSHNYLSEEDRFKNLNKMTAVVHPIYHGENIFAVIQNTNLLEGDIIRLFRQMMDRISQVRGATEDEELRFLLKNCSRVIDDSMEEIGVL